MNGALVVDKPAGPTSHDVVARVRRALGLSRVGHTGTLDPLATGVLPLVIGRATRLARFLTMDEKEYVAGIRLGSATATYDAEERVIREPDGQGLQLGAPPVSPDVSEAALQEALTAFTGTYRQMPPPFSAKKISGTPAYLLARLNKAVEMRAVEVTVHSLELLHYEGGLISLRVRSSSGFYVRSLAHDLGQRLGCGGHLETLRRTRAGEFTLAQAVPLEEIQRSGSAALSKLVPMTDLLPRLPKVVVNARGAQRVSHGHPLDGGDLAGAWESDSDPAPVAVLVVDGSGALLAVGRAGPGGLLQPFVVLV